MHGRIARRVSVGKVDGRKKEHWNRTSQTERRKEARRDGETERGKAKGGDEEEGSGGSGDSKVATATGDGRYFANGRCRKRRRRVKKKREDKPDTKGSPPPPKKNQRKSKKINFAS